MALFSGLGFYILYLKKSATLEFQMKIQIKAQKHVYEVNYDAIMNE